MKKLELGMVVCRTQVRPGAHRAAARGVVVPANWVYGGRDGALAIHHSAGHHTLNPAPRCWYLVPPEQQTTEERVRSTLWSWEPLDGDRETDEMPFALMCALLTPTEMADVFPENGDHPSGYDELAVAIAQALDRREAAREASFS